MLNKDNSRKIETLIVSLVLLKNTFHTINKVSFVIFCLPPIVFVVLCILCKKITKSETDFDSQSLLELWEYK